MERSTLPGAKEIYYPPNQPVNPETEARLPRWRQLRSWRWLEQLAVGHDSYEQLAGKFPGQPSLSRDEYINRLAALKRPEQPLDLEKLQQAPFFNFGEGFPSYPPPEYEPGTEPALAPISQEQMRLLLVDTLPPEIVPLIDEKFSFAFEPKKPRDPSNPKINIVTHPQTGEVEKIKVTFNRDNFITQGVTPELAAKRQAADQERAAYVWGFVDPSKIVLMFGKLIGRMTMPPAEKIKELIPKNFSVTTERTTAQERTELLNDRDAWATKQWEDFVGLCLTLPSEAQQRYPEAYELYQKSLRDFANPEKDNELLEKLKTLPKDGENYQMSDFNVGIDLRTNEEKAQDMPPSPQMTFLDRSVMTSNRLLRFVGLKINFSLLEEEYKADPDDDKEVAKIIENYDEKMREQEFAKIIRDSRDFDTEGRKWGRRYLLAFSKEGEFHEARVYMWLHKFSQKFRESVPIGSEISEEDYADLRAIYRLADKEGNVIGASVLPYERERITSEMNPDARYYGQEKFRYVRRIDYADAVRRKIDAKNAKAIFEGSQKTLDSFKVGGRYVDDLDQHYDERLLMPLFNDQVTANEYADMLRQMNVGAVSAISRAYAEAYYHYYQLENERQNEYMSDKAVMVMRHFGEKLARSHDAKVDEMLATPADLLADRATPEELEKKRSELEKYKQTIFGSIARRMREAHIAPPLVDRAIELLQKKGTTMQAIRNDLFDYINKPELFGKKPEEAKAQLRAIQIFFIDSDIRPEMENISRITEYQEKLRPFFVREIETAAEELGKGKGAKLLIGDRVDAKKAKDFEKLGLTITPEEEAKIKEEARKGNTNLDDENKQIRLDSEGNRITDDSIDSPEDIIRQDEIRATLLQTKLKEADPDVRLRFIGDRLSAFSQGLESNLPHKKRTSQSYEVAYKKYTQANKALKLPSLEPIQREFQGIAAEIDNLNTREQGFSHLYASTERLNKALHIIKERLDSKDKKEK